MGYVVVFEGVGGKNSNYEGIRTFTSFENKEAFDRIQAKTKSQDIIVAKGVSSEEAGRLASEVPDEVYFHVAVTKAFETGEFMPVIFDLAISNAIFRMKYKAKNYP